MSRMHCFLFFIKRDFNTVEALLQLLFGDFVVTRRKRRFKDSASFLFNDSVAVALELQHVFL